MGSAPNILSLKYFLFSVITTWTPLNVHGQCAGLAYGDWDSNRFTLLIIHENAFETVVCESNQKIGFSTTQWISFWADNGHAILGFIVNMSMPTHHVCVSGNISLLIDYSKHIIKNIRGVSYNRMLLRMIIKVTLAGHVLTIELWR